MLEIAGEIFSEGGYHSASIADIAARAGISQGRPAASLPSKPDLLLAVLTARDADAIRQLRDGDLTGVAYVNSYLRTLKDHESDLALVQLNAMISAEALADTPSRAHLLRRAAPPATRRFHPQHQRDVRFRGDAAGVTAETVPPAGPSPSPRGCACRSSMRGGTGGANRADTFALFFESLRPYLRDSRPISSDPVEESSERE
ncbi:TetR/AcrR family transcriptional regulator [Microbacterium oxydans]|nr:TetR/AcrR family transcriptional regulator [Microbacterium oxydans]